MFTKRIKYIWKERAAVNALYVYFLSFTIFFKRCISQEACRTSSTIKVYMEYNKKEKIIRERHEYCTPFSQEAFSFMKNMYRYQNVVHVHEIIDGKYFLRCCFILRHSVTILVLIVVEHAGMC